MWISKNPRDGCEGHEDPSRCGCKDPEDPRGRCMGPKNPRSGCEGLKDPECVCPCGNLNINSRVLKTLEFSMRILSITKVSEFIG